MQADEVMKILQDFRPETVISDPANVIFESRESFTKISGPNKDKVFSFKEKSSQLTSGEKDKLPDHLENIKIFSGIQSMSLDSQPSNNHNEFVSGLVQNFTVEKIPDDIELKTSEKRNFESFGSTKEEALKGALDTAVSYSKVKVFQKVENSQRDINSEMNTKSSVENRSLAYVYIKSYNVIKDSTETTNSFGEIHKIQIEVEFGTSE